MRFRLVWLVVLLPLLAVCASLAYQNWTLEQQIKALTHRPYATSGLSNVGVPWSVDEAMMIQPECTLRF